MKIKASHKKNRDLRKPDPSDRMKLLALYLVSPFALVRFFLINDVIIGWHLELYTIGSIILLLIGYDKLTFKSYKYRMRISFFLVAFWSSIVSILLLEMIVIKSVRSRDCLDGEIISISRTTKYRTPTITFRSPQFARDLVITVWNLNLETDSWVTGSKISVEHGTSPIGGLSVVKILEHGCPKSRDRINC